MLFAGEWQFPLDRIGTTVQLWQGSSDRSVPLRQARALARALPEPVLHELPEVGHMLFATRAGEILPTMPPEQA